jgi:predicted PilT family ATPase
MIECRICNIHCCRNGLFELRSRSLDLEVLNGEKSFENLRYHINLIIQTSNKRVYITRNNFSFDFSAAFVRSVLDEGAFLAD